MDIVLNWGPVASGKYKKAKSLYKAGEYVKSARVLTKELAKKPNKYGFYALAQCCILLGDHENAIKVLFTALEKDRSFHEAFFLLGHIHVILKRRVEAIGFYEQAVMTDPINEDYKQKLAGVISTQNFNSMNSNLKSVLIECMKSEQIEILFMGKAWLSVVEHDTSVEPFFELSKYDDYVLFKNDMERFSNCDGLIEPLFLAGLGRFIVTKITFENWLKFLRRYLLESIVEGKSLFTDENDIEPMICALSRYCFLSDYIMSYGSEEEKMLEGLEKKINAAGANPVLAELACYGCYKPLYALSNAKEIAAGLEGGNHVSEIPKSQIEEYLAQQEIFEEIEVLGKIKDETSREVQAQYEVFPYPRWNVAALDLFDPRVEGYLKGTKAEILIAGCGTGREAVYMANAFPDAQITAVDLSKTSLAYAIFKTRKMGIKNINFYQADIMTLADLPDWQGRFDYITSSGVLHHMKDPKAGWKVLCGLLKDKGLMRIALYSRHARWAINEAREVIGNKKIGSDSRSIRTFRDNINTHLENETIEKFRFPLDYYNLSECRDLLFHVQEQQFDLLQVKEHLDGLGLEFLKFCLRKNIVEEYKKQNAMTDPECTNLEIWDKWEQENPDVFIGMYSFWCRKSD